MYVYSAEDPTKAPVIIRAVFSNVKPIPAAAHPEYELSIEITTGISAPPIGIIKRTPTKNETKTRDKICLKIEKYTDNKLKK